MDRSIFRNRELRH